MTKPKVTKLKVTKLKVTGMTCSHCVRGITRALADVPHVERVLEVSLERGEALVEGTADPDALVLAVQQDGYAAEVVS